MSNPFKVMDDSEEFAGSIDAICKIAYDARIPVIVDILLSQLNMEQKVLFTATKWIGHGTTIDGVVIDKARSEIVRNIGHVKILLDHNTLNFIIKNSQTSRKCFIISKMVRIESDDLRFHIQDLNHILIIKMQYYTRNGFWMYLAFGVKGNANVGIALIDALQLASHLANVGDAKTLGIHPTLTTHQVYKEIIRVSVSYEVYR
ncbi:hypothetical protein RhiirA4_456234 [Rhizophagus irregularis]|uniref:Uncharacterized protein n=1 Tax=Rhizophagus irregularis TaxID=588596 RepID=A0A2I1G712_9GLOM|nr:hypothetical protein RhiirA4_456234 [Rhizophagus irregularis]